MSKVKTKQDEDTNAWVAWIQELPRDIWGQGTSEAEAIYDLMLRSAIGTMTVCQEFDELTRDWLTGKEKEYRDKLHFMLGIEDEEREEATNEE